jgi:tetratricopeptide (TPR) repeat protein
MSRALQLAPENPEYYYSLAALLRETRRHEEAEGILHGGLKLDPNNRDLLEAMAEVMLEQGRPERAIEYAQRLLRLSNSSLSARDVLGVAYLQQGRVNEALRMADQMVALSPLDASHHFKKAVLFQQQGMMRDALLEFMRVTQLAPESEMGCEARQVVEAMDSQQMRQILLLASEDPVFRTKLRRDPLNSAEERGFFLSEAGAAALQTLDLDGLAACGPEVWPAVYH